MNGNNILVKDVRGRTGFVVVASISDSDDENFIMLDMNLWSYSQ